MGNSETCARQSGRSMEHGSLKPSGSGREDPSTPPPPLHKTVNYTKTKNLKKKGNIIGEGNNNGIRVLCLYWRILKEEHLYQVPLQGAGKPSQNRQGRIIGTRGIEDTRRTQSTELIMQDSYGFTETEG